MPEGSDNAELIGRRIGRYEIVEKLGAGGMGVVYRARDARLGREVAIKTLPDELANDGERLRRLGEEAKTLASLNHPGIGAIYDLEEVDDQRFLVLELVPGETLADRLRRGALEVGEALEIAHQIAVALEAAHAVGVVHRDLKPANVKITPAGVIKVLDFGLAKRSGAATWAAGSSDARTLDVELTAAGTLLGTAAYMSPEQARGEPVDERADVWAFGCCLYECLTASRAFAGVTVADTLQAVRDREPDWERLPQATPGAIHLLLRRCLRKPASDRLHHIADARIELIDTLDALSRTASEPAPEHGELPPRRRPLGRRLAVAGAALVVLLVGYRFLPEKNAPGGEPARNRVVVATFDNQTGDDGLAPVGRMASDLIAQGLQRTGIVEVVPPTTALHAERFLDRQADATAGGDPLNALARETGAGLAVSGAYYRQGDAMRFNAQIARVPPTGASRLISSVEGIEGALDEPAGAVEMLRQRVMGALASIVDPRIEQPAEVMGHLPSYDAYKAYIEGLEVFWRSEFVASLRHFERAVELDPDYNLPRILAVFAVVNAGHWPAAELRLQELEDRRGELSPYEGYRVDQLQSGSRGDWEGAHRAALSAAAISPEFGPVIDRAYFALYLGRPREAVESLLTIDTKRVLVGWTDYWELLTSARHMLGEHGAELADARRGREQYPDSLEVLYCEGRALAALGEAAAARALLARSVDLPTQPGWTPGGLLRALGHELRTHGDPSTASEAFARALAWYEGQSSAERRRHRFGIAASLLAADRVDEASALLDALVADSPEPIQEVDHIDHLGALGVARARQGRTGEARRIAERLAAVRVPYAFGDPSVWRARLAARLGQHDRALTLLRQALAEGAARGPWIHADPDLEPLHDLPGFRQLLVPVG